MLKSIVCAVALALGATAAPAIAQTLTPLRVVTTPTDTGAQVYYAVDQGFFKKAGFDVQIDAINSGAAIAPAVQGGPYDNGHTSVAAIAIAHEHDIPFVMIAPGAAYTSKTPTSELLVSSSSTIRTASDLAGKTIAVVGLKGLTQLAVQAWLEQNHVASSSVKFTELTFTEMPQALATGRIDAAFVAEPALDRARQGGARIIGHPYDAVASDFLVGAWFVTRDYAVAHPDITRRFAAVMAEASRWANAHRDESAQILEKYTKLAASPTMVRVSYPDRLTAADVQPSIDLYARFGLLDKIFPARDLIDTGAAH
jgi:NitT/TauT family transport system substrate-binding protein